MQYINIEKRLIPYEFEMPLAGETFKFEVYYNKEHDYFTIDLYKNNEPIVLGEKVVYGRPLFSSSSHLNIPKVDILPFDISMKNIKANFDNMNSNVFLYLVGDDDETL